MKRNLLVIISFGLIFVGGTLCAQNYVALHSQNGVTHYSGTLGFKNAYSAASSGDTLYLPGGQFIVPDSIAKTIYVIGVGHYPGSTEATNKTYVTGDLKINPGAQNSYFEGIQFANKVTFKYNESINNVMFRRCRIDGTISIAGDRTNPTVNAQFIQCVLTANDSFYASNALDVVVSNCIASFQGFASMNSSLVANNIFMRTGGWIINFCNNNIFRNNIIRNNLFFSGAANLITNNVFFLNQGVISNNTFYDNYINVLLAGFFENYDAGLDFSYGYDFHLQDLESFTGADGSQVGIYGGMYPYKDGAVPFTPHVISKNISTSIDANGKVQVQIQVAAQEE